MSTPNDIAITLDNGVKLSVDQTKILLDGLKEMVSSKYMVQAQKDHQKAIVQRMKEELDGIIPVKMFNKLASIAYKDDAKKLDQETTEVLDLAEALGFYKPSED